MRLPGLTVYHLVRRVVLVWAIEVAALWLLAQVLPGMRLEGWEAAVLAVAVIALLNALVRPVLLLLTLPFTILTFGLLTIALNAFILILAAGVVPGFTLWNPGAAVGATLGLAAINTVITSFLSLNDEDSFYRNVVRRLAGRTSPQASDTPGLIMIEIDGLSKPVLEQAMRDGYMPNLAMWVRAGAYKVIAWDCGLPSQTSSSQAGILFGKNDDIPGFRWYDKERGELVVSNHPTDAQRIEQNLSTGRGLLRDGGVSIGNLLSGDATRWAATISTYPERGRRVRATSPIFFTYYLNPYNFTRAFVLMLWEVGIELWEGLRQRLQDVRPRVSRGGSFPWLRAVSVVFQRDLAVYLLMAEMFSGTPIAYTTLVGYDVVAHHAGPFRRDALRILRDFDRRILSLRRAAEDAPRPYHFVFLSDHGQSYGTPFRQRFGQTLEELVRSLVGAGESVQASVGEAEGRGWGHLTVLLSEAIRHERAAGRAARRILRARTRDGYVELAATQREEAAPGTEVLVCASGNLGLIYFTAEPGRMTFEHIAASHPHLIEGLVEHPGIDFVMATSEKHGTIVMGKHGVRYLSKRRVEGIDPLGHLGGERAAEHLRRLDAFPHSGDLVVNGRYDPGSGEVVAFEDLVGSHGGLGGPQTEAFLMYPATWTLGDDPIRNANDVHSILVRWRDALRPAPRVA